MKHISRLSLFVLLLGTVASCEQTVQDVPATAPTLLSGAIEKTSTGFYWPTGTSQIGDYAGWLSDGCAWSGNNSYYENEFHTGKDIAAAEGVQVYAIADGQVLHKSSNGWGLNNIALLIVHSLSDGSSFTAVYGHIRSDLKTGDPVEGGKPFATIGPWPDGSHLHFGIRPGISIQAPYGRMPCPSQGPITDYNAFVDPIDWITTRSPGGQIVAITPAPLPTRTPPAPVPTPTQRPTASLTPTESATPTPNTEDVQYAVNQIIYAIKHGNGEALKSFISPEGAYIRPHYPGAIGDVYPPLYSASQFVAFFNDALARSSNVACLGYVLEPNGIAGMADIYFQGIPINWEQHGGEGTDVVGFILMKSDRGTRLFMLAAILDWPPNDPIIACPGE
jgi:hypothetical protein